MKRVLLLGFILAICVLAVPQGVSAATLGTPSSAVVNAEVADHAAITVVFVPPTTPGYWLLDRQWDNELSNGIHMNVDCSQPWAVTVVTDANTVPGTQGYMLSTVGGIKLNQPFYIKCTIGSVPGNYHTLTSGAYGIASGTPQLPTDYFYNIAQPVVVADNAALSYTMTQVYTLAST